MSWEAQFRTWAQPPSDAEAQRIENARSMVQRAIALHTELSARNTKVIIQGSYRNNTNVRLDSDIDIGVVLGDCEFWEVPEGQAMATYGLNALDMTPNFVQFKDQIGEALQAYFKVGVTRGKKVFQIRSNSYHTDADVLPAFVFKEYYEPADLSKFRKGINFLTDDFTPINNYPEQHAENGIAKNQRTGGRFKSLTRVFKRLQSAMEDEGSTGTSLQSYLTECLLYNVPDDRFNHQELVDDARAALIYIYENIPDQQIDKSWFEVNGIKYLFHIAQSWNPSQAKAFTV